MYLYARALRLLTSRLRHRYSYDSRKDSDRSNVRIVSCSLFLSISTRTILARSNRVLFPMLSRFHLLLLLSSIDSSPFFLRIVRRKRTFYTLASAAASLVSFRRRPRLTSFLLSPFPLWDSTRHVCRASRRPSIASSALPTSCHFSISALFNFDTRSLDYQRYRERVL